MLVLPMMVKSTIICITIRAQVVLIVFCTIVLYHSIKDEGVVYIFKKTQIMIQDEEECDPVFSFI